MGSDYDVSSRAGSDGQTVTSAAAAGSSSSGASASMDTSSSKEINTSGSYASVARTWVIHGQAYDMTEFVDHHPGGRMAIELGRGRDCTAMFESYHALTDKADAILAKYKVDRPEVVKQLAQFKWQKNDPFYRDAKLAVRQYFANNHLDHKASVSRWIAIVIGYAFMLWMFYLYTQGWWFTLVMAPIAMWSNYPSHYHDASHFAISRSQNVNLLIQYLNPFFMSPVTWAHQHIIGHHSYTNIEPMDPDVQRSMEKRYKWWRHSMAVWPFSHLIIGFGFDLQLFMDHTFKRKVPMAEFLKTPLRYVCHFIGRSFLLYWLLVLPFHWYPLWKAVLFSVIPSAIFGTLFMFFTQMSHMTPREFEPRNDNGPSWAAHQVTTSQNIAIGSTFWLHASGALNLQIEHHLFPGVSGEHYPALVPIVRKVCEKHNVPYKVTETYWEAFQQHLELLKTCTVPGDIWDA